MISKESINSYLHFGYLVNPDNRLSLPLENLDVSFTPDHINMTMEKVIDDCLSMTQGPVVIPLSAGLDSRYILSFLLEQLETHDIISYTFGSPGHVDYDLGRLLAKRMNISHELIDLSKIEVSWEKLHSTAKATPWTYVFDSFFNRYAYQMGSSEGDNIYVGYLGGPLTEQKLPDKTSDESVCLETVKKERWATSRSLSDPGFSIHDYLVESLSYGFETVQGIKLQDKLNLFVRQANAIHPILTQQKEFSGFKVINTPGDLGRNIITPFADPRWMGLWLRAPEKCRVKQRLYKQSLIKKNRWLAAAPLKHSLPPVPSVLGVGYFLMSGCKKSYLTLLSRMKASEKFYYKAGHNYVDYPSFFREREDYIAVLEHAFNFLESNDVSPWIDFNRMMNEHLKGSHNHSVAFLILIGLAVNLDVEQRDC